MYKDCCCVSSLNISLKDPSVSDGCHEQEAKLLEDVSSSAGRPGRIISIAVLCKRNKLSHWMTKSVSD